MNGINESDEVNETNETKEINETNETKPPIFCPITQLARVLQHNYNFPISYSTLRRYVHEGVITPDYVLKRRFYFIKIEYQR
jgi:hypothetical protein